MKKNNKKAISLPLAMWLVMIMSLLAFAMLEYIVPFSREIKWVENSSVAYYQANSAIEEWLYYVYTRNNSWFIDDRDEYLLWFTSDLITKSYNTTSSWNTLPPFWEWNSEFDSNWNTISMWNPIQLSVWEWWIDSDFEIAFRVPNLDKFWTNLDVETLSWWILEIINWQLSWSGDTLNASWSIIKAENILESDDDFTDNNIDVWLSDGVILDWSSESFSNFYNNCDEKCTIKFSVINKLETIDSIIIPYLEWQIQSNNDMLPLRYSKIEASGKSYWYKKNLEVKVRGNTVNEAFDFTVFQ